MKRAAAGALLLAAGLACAKPARAPEYLHTRADYFAFRARAGALAEPNYLPFVAHRETLPDGEDGLVLCRWPDDAFPLRYRIDGPVIPHHLQHEFNPRLPAEYTTAVERAFVRWEKAIGPPVRFVRVGGDEEATLHVSVDVSEMRKGEKHVLGRIEGGDESCRVKGEGGAPDRFASSFAVEHVILHISDHLGLLTPGQVEAVALHEIGHALGAGQHSPLPGDVMFRIADDGRVEKLSEHDVNTFRALYRFPPGLLYARVEGERPASTGERGAPAGLQAPTVDERYGFRVSFPEGWQIVRSPRGWVAVDGVSWDYDASIRVIAHPGSLPEVLPGLARLPLDAELVRSELVQRDGRLGARRVMERGDLTEELWALDWSPHRMLTVVAECRTRDHARYEPWFERVLASLTPAGKARR